MGYGGKFVEQEAARRLRAQGWTLAEIVAELGVSKSSASIWCRDVAVDPTLLDERRRARWEAASHPSRKRPSRLQVEKEAQIIELLAAGRSSIGALSERDLLIAGTVLYAGEGGKTDGSVNLANSDPRMIALHLRWLRRFFAIDEKRLRVHLYLHAGLDLEAAIGFWSELTTVDRRQFTKPYRAVADPSRRRAKHVYGCPAVVYNCVATHRLVMGMINGVLSPEVLPG